MRFRAGVWVGQPSKPGNVARELKDAPVVNIVDHHPILNAPYIGREKAEIEGLGKGSEKRP
jgi:hypothetical protein